MKGGTGPGFRRQAFAAIILLLLGAIALSMGPPRSACAASGYYSGGWEGYPITARCLRQPWLCTDSVVPYEGHYIGHDEPALLFYSQTFGSGNSATYTLTLPSDPPTMPVQNGTGGTFNFQLYPALWFGMVMCDTQSYPEFTNTCTPDTDANIFDSPNAGASDYIGHHPGAAYMELQFYPPGWAMSCDATHWCVALTIDSLVSDPNHGRSNNHDCQRKVGIEPINFAFVTQSGVADAPADPLNGRKFAIPPSSTTDLFMNSGDTLTVQMNDTADGLHVLINDLTSGANGSMTASTANGFAQVLFAPRAKRCTSQPYAFHPMYATSGPHTRAAWTAHSYNVAFAYEIGHFEYCRIVTRSGVCKAGGAGDPRAPERDDTVCFRATDSPGVPIAGCTGSDNDFDGPAYKLQWPGTLANSQMDSQLHPTSVQFTSPVFQPTAGGSSQNYGQVAFETDLPHVEVGFKTCNPGTGKGCSNPPKHAAFYPFFSIASGSTCLWQFGGANVPESTNNFGGSSTSEFGPLFALFYPGFDLHGRLRSFSFVEDYQSVQTNPCLAP